MISSDKYAGFVRDKQRFFGMVKSIEDAKALVSDNEHDFGFLQEYQALIESEFNHLFESLKKNGENKEIFWMYCFYCCKLLETYYGELAYDKPELAKEYAESAQTIEKIYINKEKEQDEKSRQTFLTFLQKRFASDLGAIVSIPLHTSRIRASIGMTNLYRLLFLFSRITVRQLLLLAKELKLVGKHIDVNRLIKQINSVTGVFNIFSVGLFLARFILNIGLLLKHTLAPNEQEEEVSAWKRALHELFKRHYHYGNDAAWTTVNLLSNYPDLFNISASAANWLTAGFLIFDVLMLVIDRSLAEHEYKVKCAQYHRELRNLRDANSSDPFTRHQFDMLQDQLRELENEWKATNAYYTFNIAAALLLMASFTAPLIFTATVAATISYLLCTVAIAMYLSSGDYKKYSKASAVVADLREKNVPELKLKQELADVKNAYREFALSFVKTSLLPMVMVAIFAVSWEAALIVGIGYLGYQYIANARKDHLQTEPALPADEEGGFRAPSP